MIGKASPMRLLQHVVPAIRVVDVVEIAQHHQEIRLVGHQLHDLMRVGGDADIAHERDDEGLE